MEPATHLRLPIHKALHAEAHAVDARTRQCFNGLARKLTRGAFDCDLGGTLDIEACSNCIEKLCDQFWRKQVWRSASEVDGIDGPRQFYTHLICPRARTLQVFEQPPNIARMLAGRENS